MIVTEVSKYIFPQSEDGRWFARVYREKFRDAGYHTQRKEDQSSITLKVSKTFEFSSKGEGDGD